MNQAKLDFFHTVDVKKQYFIRNKNHQLLFDIINNNYERGILLNTKHNIIEISYFTGQYSRYDDDILFEKTDMKWFGVSYELLDLLFKKYKNDEQIILQLIKFCFNSRSKTYWLKIKNSPLGKSIMAQTLGNKMNDE